MSMEPDKWKIVKAKAATSKSFYTPQKGIGQNRSVFCCSRRVDVFLKKICVIFMTICVIKTTD